MSRGTSNPVSIRLPARVLDNTGRDLYDGFIMSMEIRRTIKRCSSESDGMFFWYFKVDPSALA